MITRRTPAWAQLRDVKDNSIIFDIKYDLILCGSRTFKSKKGLKERKPELVFSSDINGKENVNANYWHFKFEREEAAVRSGNLNPALLSCIGSDVLINKQKLELEKSRVLLDDDVITLTSIKKKFKFVYLRGHQLDLDTGRFSSNLKNKYYIGKKLGAGCNGAVHLAYDITFKAFAIKTLMRSSNDENAIQREIKTMRFIKHPNLLELFEVICDEDRVHLVTEHMNVGDMIEMINLWPMKRFTENDAKFFITQVVRGVEHLHQHNIGHMDIKLDNIFVKVKNQEYILKLGDFGYSHFDFNIQFKCGTRLYSSPEIFDKQNLVISGKQCDMWAVGVVLFCILTGHFPFHDDYSSKIKLDQQIKKVHIKWSHKEISLDAKCLILALLKFDPNDRLTASEFLKDKWFDDNDLKIRLGRLDDILSQQSPDKLTQKSNKAISKKVRRTMRY